MIDVRKGRMDGKERGGVFLSLVSKERVGMLTGY